jgi:hypothetical protein
MAWFDRSGSATRGSTSDSEQLPSELAWLMLLELLLRLLLSLLLLFTKELFPLLFIGLIGRGRRSERICRRFSRRPKSLCSDPSVSGGESLVAVAFSWRLPRVRLFILQYEGCGSELFILVVASQSASCCGVSIATHSARRGVLGMSWLSPLSSFLLLLLLLLPFIFICLFAAWWLMMWFLVCSNIY